MSEFAPGFASRYRAAEDRIARAFSGPVHFAPAEAGSLGRRGFASEAAAAQVVSSPDVAAVELSEASAGGLEEASKSALSFFRMSVTGHPARLLRVWRARRRP